MKILIILTLIVSQLETVNAAIRCSIFAGLQPTESEQAYQSCDFDYLMNISGVPTKVASCTLTEPSGSEIFFELSRTQIAKKNVIFIKRGNAQGYLPGTKIVYSENTKTFTTKKELPYDNATTRIECIEITAPKDNCPIQNSKSGEIEKLKATVDKVINSKSIKN